MADNLAKLGLAPSGAPARAARIYYGWFIVVAAFLTSFTGVGIAYSFGAFITNLSRSFTASYTAVSGLLAAALFIKALVGMGAGRLADRIGPRPVVAVAAVILCAGLLLASRATSIGQLYATYSVAVGLAAGALYVTGLDAVNHWFQRRRGEATGFALTGVAIGNLVLPPLAALLIRSVGWRTTLVGFGVGALALLLIAAWLMSASPEARGVPAEDTLPAAAGRRAAPVRSLTVADARRSGSFWLIWAAVGITALATYIPIAAIVPEAEARGFHPVVAAGLLGLVGAGSLVARLLAGVSDRVGRQRTWVAALSLMVVMFCWWYLAASLWATAIFAIGFGFANGIFFTLLSPLTADYFGTGHVGAIVGILLTGLAPGSLLGPTLAGFAFDWQHSYALAIAFGALASLVALGAVLFLRDPEAARRAG